MHNIIITYFLHFVKCLFCTNFRSEKMWILFEGLKYAFVLLWQLCIKYVRQFYTVFYRNKT